MSFVLTHAAARPRLETGLLIVVLSVVALWAFSQVFIPPSSRTCMGLYRAARTAADTAQVDRVVPQTHTAEAPTCGFIRQAARWF
jgi:hypothetical protein